MCRQQRLLEWVRLPDIIGSLRNAKKNSVLDFISGWFAFPRDHAATQVILRCSSSCLARCYKCNYVTRLVCVGLKHHCQDDAECWEERGDACCYDFSDFNGQSLDSVER